MSSKQTPVPQAQLSSDMFGMWGPAVDYMIDAGQRTVLFWDVMRQRGNQYREHLAETTPHVLSYEAELIIDGRTLNRPVNYALVRIVPPKGVTIDPQRRPFVIVGTKSDKLSGNTLRKALDIFQKTVPDLRLVPFSARTGTGRDELWHEIRAAIKPQPAARPAM